MKARQLVEAEGLERHMYYRYKAKNPDKVLEIDARSVYSADCQNQSFYRGRVGINGKSFYVKTNDDDGTWMFGDPAFSAVDAWLEKHTPMTDDMRRSHEILSLCVFPGQLVAYVWDETAHEMLPLYDEYPHPGNVQHFEWWTDRETPPEEWEHRH